MNGDSFNIISPYRGQGLLLLFRNALFFNKSFGNGNLQVLEKDFLFYQLF